MDSDAVESHEWSAIREWHGSDNRAKSTVMEVRGALTSQYRPRLETWLYPRPCGYQQNEERLMWFARTMLPNHRWG